MGLAQSFTKTSSNFQPSELDWNFIKDISERFPERQPSIYDRFHYLDKVDPSFRPRDALLLLKAEPRQGLLQRNYPYVRTIYDHKRGMSRILGMLFRESAELKFKYSGNHSRKILAHDIGEVLTTDFTPLDIDQGKITPAEKIRLEDLAMKLIFAADAPRYQAYVDYENKAEYGDYVIKAVDYLEWWDDALRINPHMDLQQELIGNAENISGPVRDILRDMTPLFFKLNQSPHTDYVGKRIVRALNAA